MYVPHGTKKIEITYKSKYNLTREKQVVLLMISNGENWHYLIVKNLSRLLRGITSNRDGDFYCLNCFHSYRTKNKLDATKKICKNHEYCHVEMPTKDNNIIKYNQGEKSIKLLFIVYADLECLLEKMSTCYNTPEESSTTKINKHTPSGYSIFTHCSFDKSKNKLNYYRGEDCITKFCKDLTKFIDSFRFMATSLSKLVDNLTEGIHSDKCINCKSDISYMKVIDETLIFRCFNCKRNYKKEINKELIERFASTYKFCNNNLNKFVMLLRKGVYPYEYMDGWDKFNETSIPSKESFYSNLTMENITETDYIHANNVFKTFKLNNLGDYHDLYVQSDTLLLADVFENFRKACIKTYKLDPAHFISLPGLAWQACLKKTGVELELLTDYDMLLMIEEGIRGGICHAVHRYAKANNRYMKDYDESKESSYIQYLDANNLYGAAMSEKLPINGFKWVNDISGINEKFVKSYDKKNSDKGYILEVDVDYPSRLHKLHSDMPFLPERMKINKTQKLVCNLHDKKNMLYILVF